MESELNPRLAKVVSRRDGMLFWAVSGKVVKVPDTDGNRQRLNQLLAKIDRMNGREVDIKFLMRGPDHPDPRTPREKMADEGTSRNNSAPPSNPFERALEAYDERNPSPESHRDRLIRQAAEWNAKREQEAAEAERLKRNGKQIEHASFAALELFFDPNAPVREVELAPKRIDVARNGSHADYHRADSEFRERLTASKSVAIAEAERQHFHSMIERKAHVDAIKAGGFAPPAEADANATG